MHLDPLLWVLVFMTLREEFKARREMRNLQSWKASYLAVLILFDAGIVP